MFNVGILGSTGLVGQQLLSLLINHKWFKIKCLGASYKNVGKKYGDICNIHESLNNFTIKPCIPTFFSDCDFVFSCLQSDISFEIEKQFLEYGILIFSNCNNFRLHPLVPLIVPTVNFQMLYNIKLHDDLKIITNANCSTTGIVTILKPLDINFGIINVVVTTLQSISGAGKYFDESIQNNIIPYIKNEEEKIQTESFKILNKTQENDFNISASCNRVPVLNGHTICMSIQFAKKPTISEVISILKSYNVFLIDNLNTPSSKNIEFIKISEDEDRPQPILDVNNSNGFCITVGRIRKCNVFDLKFTIHFNNIILGAAGSTLLNAEIYYKNKYNLS